MRSVYKYTLSIAYEQRLEVPADAAAMAIQVQHGKPQLWMLVSTSPSTPRRGILLRTYGTGQPIKDNPGTYFGTYQLAGGSLVSHVFAEWE